MNSEWKNLIESLKKNGVLKTPNIIKAFESIDRKDFVLGEYKDMAYIDEALPVLANQTISQPYTVAFMLELLQPKAGDKILDIGAGSGWQTALLAEIAGKNGEVYAMEILPELCEFGKKNVSKYDFQNVEWFCKNAEKGLSEKTPFSGIIAAASLGGKVPNEWKQQLKINGRLVAPIQNSIWLFIKNKNGKFEEYEYPGFAFVPFVNKKEL